MSAKERIGPALGKIASGLYVLTARVQGMPVGMLCSFVEQAGFEPPMISLAISSGRPLTPALEGEGRFGLHILSKTNHALVKTFARGSSPEAFAAHAMAEHPSGVPHFPEAWAFLECQVRAHLPAGDHTLYLAEVLDGVLQHSGGEPMVRVRPHGFTY